LKISGKGLRDFVLNYPYVFEVVEPEDIALPQNLGQAVAQAPPVVTPIPPDGSIAYDAFEVGSWRSFATEPDGPSAFSRSGPGIWDVIKPEVVEYGGDFIRTNNQPHDVQGGGGIPAACPELVRSTMFPPGPIADRDATGTSFSAPKVARIAAHLQRILPDEPTLLYRALIVQSAQWPTWAESILTQLRAPNGQLPHALRQQLLNDASQIVRSIGFGVPNESRATVNTDHRTTLITSSETSIRAGDCHIYQVPIPAAMRQQADDYDVRIDVTMSYVAQPRRTRRRLRRYLVPDRKLPVFKN
jgi:hypothetical protein